MNTQSPHTLTLTNGKTFTFESNASSANEQIPTIDVSRMHSENLADRQAIAEEIRHAARDIGFFSIVNHVSCTITHLPSTSLYSLLPAGRRHDTGRECHLRRKVLLLTTTRGEDGSLHRPYVRRVLRISSHAAL